MFSKFRKKLQEKLSIFSKKAEEEAEVEDIVVEKEVKAVKKKETKKKAVVEKKKETKKEIKESKQEKVEKKKVTKKEEEKVVEKEIKKEVLEEPVVEEKKSFFGKLKETFTSKKEEVEDVKEEKVEAKKEEKKKEIKEEVKEKEVKEKKVSEEVEETPETDEPKKSFLGKFKQSITTKKISADKFNDLFWELEVTLLENNVSVEVIEKIKLDLQEELVNKPLPRNVAKKIEETLKKSLTEILSFDPTDIVKQIKTEQKKPYVIALFGINGAGKTTTLAKLAHLFQQQNLSIVFAAADTFRAAAIQQLEEHANKLKVKIITHEYGADAAAVAFDAIKYAQKNSVDVVLIDTAGRLHSNVNLMAELEKLIRIAQPHLKIFVGESITGNDCIEQAKRFQEKIEVDGIILTKADVDEKGGAPLSISYTIKKPILFLGKGQRYEDLEPFDREKILEQLGL